MSDTKSKEKYFDRIRAECVGRRKRLIRGIGRHGILILRAAPQQKFSNDVHYRYRQNSSFHYLTNIGEDDVIMVLAPGCAHGDYLLFCKENSEHNLVWEGSRIGLRKAVGVFGADKAFASEEFFACLPGLLNGREHLYCDTSDEEFFADLVAACSQASRRKGGILPRHFSDSDILLHEMRLLKSAAEKRLCQLAADISMAAQLRAWRRCRPGAYEYEVAAELLHEYNRHDAPAAYPPIVAGGANACVLHYIKNSDKLKKGGLLLIDAGAEYQMYASDITRTIPVSGTFTRAQKEAYDVVLAAQRSAISKARVGNTWDTVHSACVRELTRGLVDMGLLRGSVPALIKKRAYGEYFMHGTGHWLGMDVHDAGLYFQNGAPRRFEAGMFLTIEPGLYMRAGKHIPSCWRNTGIRIEDDVFISATGAQVLTAALPKETDEVERAMAAPE